MKRTQYYIGAATLMVAAAVTGISARTLQLTQGAVTYSYTDSNVGEAKFSEGKSVTIGENTYPLSEVTGLKVTDTELADNTVEVVYQGATAHVYIAGNIAGLVTATVTDADVVVDQSSEVGDNTGEITYRISGESTDGSFTMNGSYKASVELAGVSLTSSKGAAVSIQCGKRINMRIVEGTENILEDCAGGSQKAALYCKGHMEFKQKGRLSVTGHTAHAISAKEYITVKNSKITVLGSVKDGLNCNQYFAMESGTLDISGVGDDGIQVSYKDDVDREAEDTGSITITGGTLNVAATALAAKAIKADGDITVSAGTITASVAGDGIWDADALKTKAAACLSADGVIEISGGEFNLKATGSGGKGISCDGEFHSTGGVFNIATTGGLYYNNGKTENKNYTGNTDNINSNYKSSPKGIKSDVNVNIDGGTFDISTKANGGEGIESKNELTINDGTIRIRAYDDGLNSSKDMHINGGKLDIISTKCDALDSNASMYLNGGEIRAFGATGAEEGLDIDSGTMAFTGGYILGVGGRNTAPNNSASTQPYVSGTLTIRAGQDLTVSDSAGEVLYTFVIPTDFITGSAVLVSVPGMEVGTKYTLTCGTSSVTLTAAQYSTGGNQPGGGGGGGRPR